MKYDLSLFSNISDPTPETIIETFQELNDVDEQWWEWEPETIKSLIDGNIDHRMGLIMACASLLYQTLHEYGNHIHWNEPDVFGSLCVEFDGVSASIEHFERPTLSQMMYTLDIMKSIDDNVKPEEDVYQYMAVCLIDQGIVYMPGQLQVNKIISDKLKGREGFSRKLIDDIEDMLIMDRGRVKSILNGIDESNPVHVQVGRIMSAFELVSERNDLGKRQIGFMKRGE